MVADTCWRTSPVGAWCVLTTKPPMQRVSAFYQAEKLVSKTTMLHVSVAPAPPTSATAAATAQRIVKSITVQWQPSGVVARKLTLDPRTLGKITSALLLLAIWIVSILRHGVYS